MGVRSNTALESADGRGTLLELPQTKHRMGNSEKTQNVHLTTKWCVWGAYLAWKNLKM